MYEKAPFICSYILVIHHIVEIWNRVKISSYIILVLMQFLDIIMKINYLYNKILYENILGKVFKHIQLFLLHLSIQANEPSLLFSEKIEVFIYPFHGFLVLYI